VLEVENLRTAVPGDGPLRPVDGVSFDIAPARCFALLGESGCGKSMTALSLMRLLPAAAASSAARAFDGRDLLRAARGAACARCAAAASAMIFQEPAPASIRC
jgi:ABC-type dipeptide/oligopeptide/nickel transport system ATPase component